MANERELEALQLTREAMEANRTIQQKSLSLGRIYQRINSASLYKEAGHASFELWLKAVGEHGLSQAYSIMKTYGELEATIPAEDLKVMPMNNARDLTLIPESKRSNPEVLAAAKELTNSKFRDYVDKQVVSGISFENTDYKGFRLTPGAHETVTRAIKEMIDSSEGQVKTSGGAIESICADWMAGRGGESAGQRAAVAALVRKVEEVINAMLPDRKSPTPREWAQVVMGIARVQQVYGFTKADARPAPVAGKHAQAGGMVQ